MLRCSSVITALTRGKTITKLKTPAAACCGAEWRLHLSLDGRKSSSTLEKQSENRPELFPLLSPLWTDLGSLVFLLCGSCKMHRISDFTTDQGDLCSLSRRFILWQFCGNEQGFALQPGPRKILGALLFSTLSPNFSSTQIYFCSSPPHLGRTG